MHVIIVQQYNRVEKKPHKPFRKFNRTKNRMDHLPWGSSERCGDGRSNVGHEMDGILSGQRKVQQGQNHESLQQQSQANGSEIQAQLTHDRADVVHFQNFGGHQKQNAHGREQNHPTGDLHHHGHQAVEEVGQRFGFLA